MRKECGEDGELTPVLSFPFCRCHCLCNELPEESEEMVSCGRVEVRLRHFFDLLPECGNCFLFPPPEAFPGIRIQNTVQKEDEARALSPAYRWREAVAGIPARKINDVALSSLFPHNLLEYLEDDKRFVVADGEHTCIIP